VAYSTVGISNIATRLWNMTMEAKGMLRRGGIQQERKRKRKGGNLGKNGGVQVK
jgi:hypothetical protein